MRNPFKRQPRPADKPTLRERMAATREKFGRTLRVHRALNDPTTTTEPAPNRAALVNYATFLAWERNRVCAELYPHLGGKAAGFVLAMNAAERFFYPKGINNGLSRSWRDVPPASTRAVAVLDLVGVDWRSDPLGDGIERGIGFGQCADTGQRPAVPYGWPAIDAALTSALAELRMIDAAMAALMQGHSRDAEDVPGYSDLDDVREAAIDALELEPARGLIGLQAKAMALQVRTIAEADETTGRITRSLARDLIAIDGRTVEPRPDPIFAAIKECERLEAISTVECAKPSGADGNCTPAQTATIKAVWQHIDGPLPITAWTGLLADIERIAGATTAQADDAELIALGRAFDVATVRDRAANDALNAAEDRAEPHMPERPAALIYREEDNLFPLREYGDACAGVAVSPSDIEWMTRCPAQREVWVDDPRKGIESSEKLGRHRWVVERTHAWFNRFRRLTIRYERRVDIYEAFTSLAASLITLNQINRFC